ncbi:MAG: 50S ribosomal protein L5 [Mycoplasmatales bacterium]
MSFIEDKYKNEVKADLMKEFKYSSIMQVPKIDKIVVNMGLGEAAANSKIIDEAAEELKAITGQKPAVTKAKTSIAGFKLREEQPIGLKVTLRGPQMYNFLDKLIGIALPRVRDFQGINPKAFDGRGNYTLGVTEQMIFSEIDYDKVNAVRGMDITVVTTANTNEEGLALLTKIGMPFIKRGE